MLLITFVVTAVSCTTPKVDSYELIVSTDSLVFELNPQTSMFIKALFPYTNKDGREYLTFQNDIKPEILWYDMSTQEYIKTITLDKEGKNGISSFVGYYVSSENEIYIPDGSMSIINVVNEDGIIIRKIPYERTSQGKSTVPFNCLSFPYTPIYVVNNNFYLPQSPNMALGDSIIEDSPVTLLLDTINNSVTEGELKFPPVLTSKEVQASNLGVELSYSKCYDGSNFIYSFFFDEDVYVASLNGTLKNKVKVKSRYIEKVYDGNKMPNDMIQLVQLLNEIPMYGNLIYDECRQVYYRFAYPQTELNGGNYMDMWQLGRSKFSIIILDKDLNIIGETLFPENTYASNHFFIRRDGLYISTSFVKNPNYDDDKLCFRRFDLVRDSKNE